MSAKIREIVKDSEEKYKSNQGCQHLSAMPGRVSLPISKNQILKRAWRCDVVTSMIASDVIQISKTIINLDDLEKNQALQVMELIYRERFEELLEDIRSKVSLNAESARNDDES